MQDATQAHQRLDDDALTNFSARVVCILGGAVGMIATLIVAVLVFAVDPLVVTGGYLAGCAWAVVTAAVAEWLRNRAETARQK